MAFSQLKVHIRKNLVNSFNGWISTYLFWRFGKTYLLQILWAPKKQKYNMIGILGMFLAHKISKNESRNIYSFIFSYYWIWRHKLFIRIMITVIYFWQISIIYLLFMTNIYSLINTAQGMNDILWKVLRTSHGWKNPSS